jgi:hypothetical protein
VRGSIPPPPGGHRLGLGLPGYLILFAPPAFGPERQVAARALPTPSVFLRISTHFTAPPGIPRPSPRLSCCGQPRRLGRPPPVEPVGFHSPPLAAACAPFTPSNSGQRSPPTYYRGCWHVVSRGFFLGYRPEARLFTAPPPRRQEKRFTTRRPSSRTRRRSVRLSPIAEDSSLLPPVGVWAVLNPSVADHPLRPATDRRLGAPLPPQLANRPQPPPPAPAAPLGTASFLGCGLSPQATVCGLSPHFCGVSPTGRVG